MTRRRSIMSTCLFALVLAGCASEQGVMLVDNEERVRGCRPLGTVSDNDMQDLQKKAAKLGGNTALMTPERKAKGGILGMQDYQTADVYSCGAK
jgi:hypothetical protein